MQLLVRPAAGGPDRQFDAKPGQFVWTGVHFNGPVMLGDDAVTDRLDGSGIFQAELPGDCLPKLDWLSTLPISRFSSLKPASCRFHNRIDAVIFLHSTILRRNSIQPRKK